MLPPPHIIRDARQRHQFAQEALVPDTVTLNSISYQCSADLSEIKPEFDESLGGTREVQTATVRIRRDILTDRPAASSRVVLQDLEWFIESFGDQLTASPVWLLNLKRIIRKAP